MKTLNPSVDLYLDEAHNWQEEMQALRMMLLNSPLTEEWKWKQPCYTINKNNIVILHCFKDYCGLGFFKGSLMKDPKGILVKPGENTQGGRQLRFSSLKEIKEMETIIHEYINDAIAVESSGMKVDYSPNKKLVYPEELQNKLSEDTAFENAFNKLTPGRQRAYNLYFSAPKQSKTRSGRIEKYEQKILDGIGFHDCTCGHSKRMPNCDGSHKYI